MAGDIESSHGPGPSAELVADFVHSLCPQSVLVAGVDVAGLLHELQRRGIDATGACGDATELAATQLARRYDLVMLSDLITTGGDASALRGLVHFCAGHVLPSGVIVCAVRRGDDDVRAFDARCAESELDLVEQWGGWDRRPVEGSDVVVSVRRRASRFNVHDMLFEARASIQRLTPHEVMQRLSGPEPPIVVDTRTDTDRTRFGAIDGAIHAPRSVVEWHLDPANGYRHPAIHSFDQPIVVVCNGGYSSSLSAANLARIGFTDVADMIGGMAAWIQAGLPTVVPTYSHLGY